MKKIVVLFLLALVIVAAWWATAGAAIPGPEVGVFLSPVEIPPFTRMIQLMGDPDFEAGPGGVMWTHYGTARVDDVCPFGGTYALSHGREPSSYSWTEQEFVLDGCQPGPVWIRAAWAILTPSPLENPWYDVTEGWIMNEQNVSVAELWTRYDIDTTGGYEDPWIRVEGLFDACQVCTLVIASSVDPNPESVTVFCNDDVEVWCLHPPFRVYVPLVVR